MTKWVSYTGPIPPKLLRAIEAAVAEQVKNVGGKTAQIFPFPASRKPKGAEWDGASLLRGLLAFGWLHGREAL